MQVTLCPVQGVAWAQGSDRSTVDVANEGDASSSVVIGSGRLLTVSEVALQVAVPASTLRSWDQRHDIGPTFRTPGNHRRYSDNDVHRVLLMAQLTGQGLPASAAAAVVNGMSDAAVRSRAERAGVDRSELHLVPDPSRAPSEAIIAAATALDSVLLTRLVKGVLRGQPLDRSWTEVFVPALHEIGDKWSRGELGIQSEHLVSEVLSAELRQVSRAEAMRQTGAPVIITSADRDFHHLPLLVLEAVLSQHGVRTTMLGPSMPYASMAAAAERTMAREMFLWASLPRPRSDDLRPLALPGRPQMTVVIGGPGWPAEPTFALSPAVVVRYAPDLQGAVSLLLEARERD